LQIGNKLIPATISQAINENPIQIHGNGFQTRDWIHVEDHCSALRYISSHGEIGQSYNIGANNEQTNISVVHNICTVLDEIKPRANGRVYSELIEFGEDKPNNLHRCAVNTDKLNQLGWYKKRNFNESIKTLIVHALKST
jgi:dTDP-glucose 4,6-dehydratase